MDREKTIVFEMNYCQHYDPQPGSLLDRSANWCKAGMDIEKVRVREGTPPFFKPCIGGHECRRREARRGFGNALSSLCVCCWTGGLMLLRTRILRVVSGDHGPASKNLLLGIAKHHGCWSEFDHVFRELLDSGELVMIGDKRGALYGVPTKRRRAA